MRSWVVVWLLVVSPAVALAQSQADIAARLNKEGETAHAAKQYAVASAKFREAVARVPDPVYFYNLCSSLYQEGKFGEALTSCDAVAKNNPKPELQAKATQLTDRVVAEAKKQGIKIQATPPTSQSGGSQAVIAAKLNKDGEAALAAKRYADASTKFREAVARVPEASYFYNLCVSLFEEGKFGEALVACDAVAGNNPRPDLKTKATQLTDRIRAAAKKQGITVDATTPPTTPSTGSQAAIAAQLNRDGEKALAAKRHADATAKFREAVARVPEAPYFYNLCVSLFEEGKFAEALTACQAVEHTNPKDVLKTKARMLVQKILMAAKKQGIDLDSPPPQSGTQAEIATKLNQDGEKALAAKRYSEASSKFREAVARVPDPLYFYNLCVSLYQEGKFAEALTSCSAVAKNNPRPDLTTKTTQQMDRIRAEAKRQGINVEPP